jgi:Flp pilus assembly protein TadG
MNAIRQQEEGSSFVELALVLPVLLLLFLGMIDFGLSYNTYITLSNGAREGARWISTNRTNPAGARERVLAEVARGDLTSFDVTITFNPAQATYEQGDLVTITISHDRPLAFGAFTGFPSVTLTASSTMRVLY